MTSLYRMLILACTAAVVAGAAPAPPPAQTQALSAAIAKLLAAPAYAHATFGIAVYDVDAKRTIYARNANRLFVPASTTKLMTTGTVLAALGPERTFTTPVYRTGPVDASGVLHGDLVLVASGDPNLSQRIRPDGTLAFENEDHSYDGTPDTKAVPGDPLAVLRELARAVYASGIRRITGRAVVDASLFPDGGPEFGTGVDVSPIVVNDNVVDVVLAPGAKAGDPARIVSISPETPYATFANAATTGAAKSDATIAFPDAATPAGMRAVTISGSLPADAKPTLYAYRVPSPPRFAEAAFTLALNDAGVLAVLPPPDPAQFDRAAYAPFYTQANLVAKHVSLPLREDVRITLKVSDNLHASMMPYLVSVYAAHSKDGGLQAGFDWERRFLGGLGLDLSAASQQDGAGGSAAFTPAFVVAYLAAIRSQPWFADLYRGLPVLGVDGTLFNIANSLPARGKVFAKTGTDGAYNALSRGGLIDKGLAGYMRTRSGRSVAFCIYINQAVFPHGGDPSRIAGQTNGAIANAIYESL